MLTQAILTGLGRNREIRVPAGKNGLLEICTGKDIFSSPITKYEEKHDCLKRIK